MMAWLRKKVEKWAQRAGRQRDDHGTLEINGVRAEFKAPPPVLQPESQGAKERRALRQTQWENEQARKRLLHRGLQPAHRSSYSNTPSYSRSEPPPFTESALRTGYTDYSSDPEPERNERSTIYAGRGGSFDGGGASGDWDSGSSSDSSSSSSDSSSSSSCD